MSTKPTYLDLSTWGVCAIAGKTGSGKTATARLLAAQFALAQYQILLCDMHGNRDDQTIASIADPLKVKNVYRDKESILEAIEYVYDKFTQQIEKNTRQKIVMFLDESPAFFMSCSAYQTRHVSAMLLRMANEARKTSTRIVMLGQNWKQDYSGSRDIRSSIGATILHRLDDSEIKLLASQLRANDRRTISNLRVGHAAIIDSRHALRYVKIPYITIDDLYTITDLITLDHGIVMQDHDNDTIAENTRENRITLILHYYDSGFNKEQIIKKVFNIRKGGRSESWKQASLLYDYIIKKHR